MYITLKNRQVDKLLTEERSKPKLGDDISALLLSSQNNKMYPYDYLYPNSQLYTDTADIKPRPGLVKPIPIIPSRGNTPIPILTPDPSESCVSCDSSYDEDMTDTVQGPTVAGLDSCSLSPCGTPLSQASSSLISPSNPPSPSNKAKIIKSEKADISDILKSMNEAENDQGTRIKTLLTLLDQISVGNVGCPSSRGKALPANSPDPLLLRYNINPETKLSFVSNLTNDVKLRKIPNLAPPQWKLFPNVSYKYLNKV